MLKNQMVNHNTLMKYCYNLFFLFDFNTKDLFLNGFFITLPNV